MQDDMMLAPPDDALPAPLDAARTMAALDAAVRSTAADEFEVTVLARSGEYTRFAGQVIHQPQDIAVDPHFAARKMIQSVIRPDGRPLDVVGSPIKLSGSPAPTDPVRIAAPGADNRQVLVERFGVSAERYEQLVREGLIGSESASS